MRKSIILIAALAWVSMFTSAQSYFKDGVVWRAVGWVIGDKKIVYENTSLDGTENVDGYEALKMYNFYEGITQREFYAYIRTDGDKVYFKKPGLKTDDWLLIYDFGLKPGEVRYIYSLWLVDDGIPMGSYVKCSEIVENGKGDWTTMYVDEYKDEACSKYRGSDIWLKGLSAFGGVAQNVNLGMDSGAVTYLYEVSYNGETVYYDGTVSVDDNVRSGVSVNRDGNVLTVNGARAGSRVAVYSAAGVLLGKTTADGAAVSVKLPAAGLLIVKVGDKVFKVK